MWPSIFQRTQSIAAPISSRINEVSGTRRASLDWFKPSRVEKIFNPRSILFDRERRTISPMRIPSNIYLLVLQLPPHCHCLKPWWDWCLISSRSVRRFANPVYWLTFLAQKLVRNLISALILAQLIGMSCFSCVVILKIGFQCFFPPPLKRFQNAVLFMHRTHCIIKTSTLPACTLNISKL